MFYLYQTQLQTSTSILLSNPELNIMHQHQLVRPYCCVHVHNMTVLYDVVSTSCFWFPAEKNIQICETARIIVYFQSSLFFLLYKTRHFIIAFTCNLIWKALGKQIFFKYNLFSLLHLAFGKMLGILTRIEIITDVILISICE